MNVFLLLALVCAVIAFLQEVAFDSKFLWSLAGWLILTLVFYLASLVFGFSVGTKPQNKP